MTLPVPSEMTATVGATLTSAEWNSNVRDGINFLANPPVFVGYQTSAQSIAASTRTAVGLDSEVTDTYSGHSNTTNNARYTAQVAGWYEGDFRIAMPTETSGFLHLGYGINSTTPTVELVDALSTPVLTLSDMFYLNVGDYVQLLVEQSYSTSLSVVVTSRATGMTLRWVHS